MNRANTPHPLSRTNSQDEDRGPVVSVGGHGFSPQASGFEWFMAGLGLRIRHAVGTLEDGRTVHSSHTALEARTS